MSKVKGNKKLSSSKFRLNVCKECMLCDDNKPTFCRAKLYNKNPSLFIKTILPGFISHNTILSSIMSAKSDNNIDVMIVMFKRLVCDTGICVGCNKVKDKVINCIDLLRQQAGYVKKNKSIVLNAHKIVSKDKFLKHKKNNKEKKVPPKVSIIISNNPEFQEEVRRIIEDNFKQ